jgi:low temperature requirement protein LtrA
MVDISPSGAAAAPLLRAADGRREVTNLELFFDLVYVFAVTQLSHLLVHHTTPVGAVQTLVLLGLVWQAWVYTAWMTNYLDPDTQAVRGALVVLMLTSLVMSAALPQAFGSRPWAVAGAYVAMQVGRTVFLVWATRGHALQATFSRVLVWSCATGGLVLLGAAAPSGPRAGLWALAFVLDLVGAALGFWAPRLGRSSTLEWTIDGGHFAERCQAFVLIALGESIIVIGTTWSSAAAPGAGEIAAFVAAFAGSVALWWVYFDRAAADSARRIAQSADPGRLGRNAFHWVHPVIIAGIIVAAAADDVVLADPFARGRAATSLLVLGGSALYLGGHAIFKAVVWRLVSWPRVVAVLVLAALLVLAPHVSALVLALLALVVIVAVAVADRVLHPVLS